MGASVVTPEQYRILFDEDPPVRTDVDDAPVVDDLTIIPDPEKPRFTNQPMSARIPQDTRPWWRKKRVQFPAAILTMIVLLSFDDGNDQPAQRPVVLPITLGQ